MEADAGGLEWNGRLWRAVLGQGGTAYYLSHEIDALSAAERHMLQVLLHGNPRPAKGDAAPWKEWIRDALQGGGDPFPGPVRIDDEWERAVPPFRWPVFAIGLKSVDGRSSDLLSEAQPMLESLTDAVEFQPHVIEGDGLMVAIFPVGATERVDERAGEETARALQDGLRSEGFVEARAVWSGLIRGFPELLQTVRRFVHILRAAEVFLENERLFGVRGLGVYELLLGVRQPLRQAYVEHVLPSAAVATLGAELEQTVAVFVQCDLNMSETARQIYLHRNSLLYRIERIRDLTGYDIRHFADAVTVWTALLLRRL